MAYGYQRHLGVLFFADGPPRARVREAEHDGSGSYAGGSR